MEQKRTINEMVKMKNPEILSIWKENESRGNVPDLNEKANPLSAEIVAIEKQSPQRAPAIAKHPLQRLDPRSDFRNSNEPSAPTANSANIRINDGSEDRKSIIPAYLY